MTHTLHRQGSVEALKEDYVVIAYTSSMNRQWARPYLSKVAEIVVDAGPSNVGSSYMKKNMAIGFDRDEFVNGVGRANSVAGCVSSREKLREIIQKLKEADTGISITISGLIDEVIPMAQEMGLKPHTINLSLGIVGSTDRLAEPEELGMTTMCGHAMISSNLVRKLKQDVAAGIRTPREASMMLGRPCVCGIFNLDRCEKAMWQP